MKKLSFNKPLLFSLITAFVFLQWSATHIHLAGEHEHNSGKHQHQVTVHQHQSVGHHADVIDVASTTLAHSDSHKVVDLDHVCTQFHGKLGDIYAAIPFSSWASFEQKILSKIAAIYYQQDVYQSYHQYTSVRLRAPPIVS